MVHIRDETGSKPLTQYKSEHKEIYALPLIEKCRTEMARSSSTLRLESLESLHLECSLVEFVIKIHKEIHSFNNMVEISDYVKGLWLNDHGDHSEKSGAYWPDMEIMK